MLVRILASLAAITLVCAANDTITFRDGRSVSGSYLGGDSRQIRVVVGDKIQSYSIPDIAKIEFGSANSTASAPPAPAPGPPPSDTLQPSRIQNPPPATPQAATLAEIPSGTQMVIRLIDPVDSETDRLGQTYRATLDEPIVVGGETIVPRGADVVAKLVDDKQSGKLAGQTVLTLDLQTLTVNGRPIDIDTEEVSQASASRTGRSGKVIGGAAALGAIIGAIAGGGKGAAIGTVAGAGAGTAAQVITKGQKVKIPSETRLTFTLQNPVRLSDTKP
jgi:hypothetical protein